MIEDDIPDNPYMTDPDGDWPSRIGIAIAFAICACLLAGGVAVLLHQPIHPNAPFTAARMER